MYKVVVNSKSNYNVEEQLSMIHKNHKNPVIQKKVEVPLTKCVCE